MANHSYKNFASVQERVAFQNAVIDATKKMPLILKDARANTKDTATNTYNLFFGAINQARMETVIGILSAIDLALNSGGVTFVRVYTGKGANNCAATKPPYGVWQDQTPAQIAKSAHAAQHSYVMTVGDHFYTATNSLDRTIKSAQFNTVCHEFSHLVGDTLDPVYGSVGARVLARDNPNQAIRCAENYGFYCEQLYLGLG